MAQYTVELRTLLNNPQTKAEIDKALSEYPMYERTPQPEYISTREQLNKKLLDHYKYYEIEHTVGRFIDELRIVMNEIMPYYVQLYESHDLMKKLDDPFGNVDIVETFEQETEGTSKDNSTGKTNSTTETNATSTTDTETTNNSKNVKSSTPQTQISIPANEIDSVTGADEVNWNKDDSTSSGETKDNATSTTNNTVEGTSNNETTGKTKHTLTRKGNQGVSTYAHDMKELRETFLNIDKMIITDERINELFMHVW